MLRSVVRQSLRAHRRSLIGWSIGMAVVALYVMALYPSVHSGAASIEQYIEQMPSGLREAFLGEMAASEYSSPAGYLQTEIFSLMAPLLFLFFAVAHGSRAVAGDEEKGELELVLATPLSRTTLVLGEFAALAAGAALLAAVMWAGLVVMGLAVGVSFDAWTTLQAMVSAWLLGLLFGAVALAAGCVRGRRALAITVASTLAIAAYLFNTFALIVDGLHGYRILSPFQWYAGGFLARDGLQAGGAVTLAVTIAVMVAVAATAVRHRDMGT